MPNLLYDSGFSLTSLAVYVWTQAKYAELMGDLTGAELGERTARGNISPSKFLQPKGNYPVPFPENFSGLSDCHPLSWGNPRTATGHMLRDVEKLRTPPTMPPLPKSPRLRSLDQIRQVSLRSRSGPHNHNPHL